MSVEIATPFLVQLHLVKRCIFKCKYCYLRDLSDKDILDVEEVMNFLDKLSVNLNKVCGDNEIVLNLIGGDIIKFYPRIEKLLRRLEKTTYVSSYSLAINSLWNSDIDISKYQKLTRVQLNVDVRLEQLKDDIKKIISADKFVNLKLNLSKETDYLNNQIDKMSTLRKCFNYDSRLQLSLDRICPTDKKFLDSRLNNSELKSVLERIEKKFGLNSMINEDPFLEGFFNPSRKIQNDSIYGCSAGRSSITVYPNKQIKLCARIPSFQTGYNVNNFDLLQFLVMFSEIRNKNLKNCNKCNYFNNCLGGCPATSYLDKKEITYDYNCYRIEENGN